MRPRAVPAFASQAHGMGKNEQRNEDKWWERQFKSSFKACNV